MNKYLKMIFKAAVCGAFVGGAFYVIKKLSEKDRLASLEDESISAEEELDALESSEEEAADPEEERIYTSIPLEA